MTDYIKITCAASADRDALVTILFRNGYTVYVEFWQWVGP